MPAGYVGGYCSGSVGLDVFGLWEIRWFVLCSGLAFYFKGFYWVDWSLLMLCFFCACFAAGYWIFVPFILFHFIGLVAAAVLGFVRVSMLSSLRFASASVQSFKSSVGDNS
ncbi:hypothetical protein POTOM_061704 [Populus tomentosa]|uniref:Uncharacterized protein n=1 Tax=Populus tomentosa TaxID=118781 RepID=A0A8X8BZJ8_POPTO|nr:hypothetical protein POTOM_061704 [Populus tomentosa]